MNASERDDCLAALARGALDRLSAPVLARFLADWPSASELPVRRPEPVAPAPSSAAPSSAAPSSAAPALPVLRWLPRIAADGASFGGAFVSALCRAAPSLAWRQSYTRDEVDAAFLQNYGWTELLRAAAMRQPKRTSAQISCGVVVLGPGTLYPHHRHEAEEIYVPLSGTAAWQQGDAVWREHAPGTLIHHLSEEPHAMRTGEEPLLALYLWRSSDLAQKARLDRRVSA
jgi:quercetin dioxygenase-like cupin family protein